MLKDPKWNDDAPSKYPLRQVWFDAMRSGHYTQVQGRFGDPERGFCAIGLAQYIVAVAKHPNNPMEFFLSGDMERELVEQMGFRDSGGGFAHDIYGWGTSFINANDFHRRSFKEIADFAEEHMDLCFLRDNEEVTYPYDDGVELGQAVIVIDDGKGPVAQQPMPYDEKCAQQAKYAAECLNAIDAIECVAAYDRAAEECAILDEVDA